MSMINSGLTLSLHRRRLQKENILRWVALVCPRKAKYFIIITWDLDLRCSGAWLCLDDLLCPDVVWAAAASGAVVADLGVPGVVVVGADEGAAVPLALQQAERAAPLVQADFRRRQHSL